MSDRSTCLGSSEKDIWSLYYKLDWDFEEFSSQQEENHVHILDVGYFLFESIFSYTSSGLFLFDVMLFQQEIHNGESNLYCYSNVKDFLSNFLRRLKH